MKKIKLYNSLSNQIEEFKPINEKHIKLYVCGPTVYDTPHVGNARPLIIFDVLFRLLKNIYPKVTYVRNITDVDDKINNKAKELNIHINDLTTEIISKFHKYLKQLNILDVTHEPRATHHIQEMIEFIENLISKNLAYESAGHVYFSVSKSENYGILSNRKIEDMNAGARIEVSEHKQENMDFVLWKPSINEDPGWDSPFGRGRPGWHLECSSMSLKYLGKQFDIHGGGQDLIFPHHENEIAQSFAASNCLMANYWIHNNMLLVNNNKMSKSLNNIITLDSIFEKYNPEIIRYLLLSTHYQKILNWTEDAIYQAKQSLNRLYEALKKADDEIEKYSIEGNQEIIEILCDNINTPLALKKLQNIADEIFKETSQKSINQLCQKLKNEAYLLGILQQNTYEWFQGNLKNISTYDIEKLMNERSIAKANKEYKLADDIRKKLNDHGIDIEDTKSGTIWKKSQ